MACLDAGLGSLCFVSPCLPSHVYDFALAPLISYGMSGCWAEMTLLCLPLSALVFDSMSGGWDFCFSLSPLVSHGMSGC